MQFRWSEGSRFKADPNVVGQRIIELSEKGTLTPNELIEDARDLASPLHTLIDWDNNVAGDKWRQHQARNIMRSILVRENDNATFEKVMYKIITNKEPPSGEYTRTTVIRDRPDLQEKLLTQAIAELKAFKKRFCEIAELAGVMCEIDKLLKED